MTPTKFQHAGLDWIPHIPGDPMPCPGDTMVRVLFRDGTQWLDPIAAFDLYWGNDNHKTDVIGWHPIKDQHPMTPNRFTHAGLDWIPHTPGDQMPCHPDTLVRVLMRGDLHALCDVTNYETSASIWDWDVCTTETMAEIIGWHTIEN